MDGLLKFGSNVSSSCGFKCYLDDGYRPDGSFRMLSHAALLAMTHPRLIQDRRRRVRSLPCFTPPWHGKRENPQA
jgi:hypothetical protein